MAERMYNIISGGAVVSAAPMTQADAVAFVLATQAELRAQNKPVPAYVLRNADAVQPAQSVDLGALDASAALSNVNALDSVKSKAWAAFRGANRTSKAAMLEDAVRTLSSNPRTSRFDVLKKAVDAMQGKGLPLTENQVKFLIGTAAVAKQG
jgi:hypothetical protein